MKIFGESYAQMYDAMHSNKNYESEVEYITQLLDLSNNQRLIGIDFGTGTGNFLKLMFDNGHDCYGYDISPEMLEIARSKLPTGRIIENLSLVSTKFDYCITLFDVLSYQNSLESLITVLKTINSLLKPSGLLVADFWNGDELDEPLPKNQNREFFFNGTHLMRTIDPIIFPDLPGVFELRISISDAKRNVLFSEQHNIRAFTKKEMEFALHEAGFQVRTYVARAIPTKNKQSSSFKAHFLAKKIENGS